MLEVAQIIQTRSLDSASQLMETKRLFAFEGVGVVGGVGRVVVV